MTLDAILTTKGRHFLLLPVAHITNASKRGRNLYYNSIGLTMLQPKLNLKGAANASLRFP